MRRCTSLALLLSVAACNSTSTVGGMRARAADEWSCPESAIEVSNQGQNAYRVSGCGQTALYECSGDSSLGPQSPPQSNANAAEEYRFQGAGSSCHKVSRD
jgi:hypothetical protein